MRILYHHRTMGDGAEGIHIREIVRALRAIGHDVQVEALAGDPMAAQGASPSRSRVSSLRRLIPASAYECAELGYNIVGYRRVMAAVRRFRPDVIYDRYNTYSTAAWRAARAAKLPLLLEVNSPMVYERSEYENLPLKFPRLAARYERSIFNGADRIFAVSTPLQRYLVDELNIDERKIVVLPNGADPDVFVPADGETTRRRYHLEGQTVVGFVGILRPWHGVDLLLGAFAELRRHRPSTHLLLVGDGPIEEQIAAQARDLGLATAVTLTGRLTHPEVVSHVAAMDICVSPRATFYASPMKILEYLAMGKAVVAPDMDNIRDIISHGRTGILFAPQSASAMGDALRRLVDDDHLRRALGEEGRRSVIERFNWRSNASRIVAEAEELVRARSRAGTVS
jgi:glycosyltransferase involved in cell wall biosynthesis